MDINFLAHLYLSGPNEKIALGNFMGDFVKGKEHAKYDRLIQVGILLHREIDHFTDSHPLVKKSTSRLKEKYRHYAGVIVDVFYDHYLAKNFEQFSSTPLESFVEQQYHLLQNNENILPARAKSMLPYMIRGNWLVNYKEPRGIQKALQGMSRRTTFDSKMDEAIKELKEYDDIFQAEFLSFFPIIIKHAQNFREELVNS